MMHPGGVSRDLLVSGPPDPPAGARPGPGWVREEPVEVVEPEPYEDRDDVPVPAPAPARRTRRARAAVLAVGTVLVLAAVAGLRQTAPPGAETASPDRTSTSRAAGPETSYTLLLHTGTRLVRAEGRSDGRSVSPVPLPSAPGDVQVAWVTQVATVVALPVAERAGSVQPVVAQGGTAAMLEPARAVFRGPGGASIWLAEVGRDGRERLREVRLDGRVESAPRLVPAGWRVAAVRRAGAVLERTDGSRRLAHWLPHGTVRDLRLRGRVDPAAGAWLLVDTGGTWVAVDLQADTRTPLRPPPGLELLTPPVLSRDGAMVAALVRERSVAGRRATALAIGTVAAGARDLAVQAGTQDTDPRTLPVTPVWAADGQVYGALSGAVYGLRPGEPRAWRVPGTFPPLRRIWVY